MKFSSNKRYILLCALFCCAFFLSGCEAESKQINAPVDIRCIVQNPLVLSEVTENDQFGNMTYTGSYFLISGLKDQQVEDTVNERLKAIYAQYQPGEIPLEAKEKYAGLECVKQDIELICSGNFNNILSIRANYSWEYKDEKEELRRQGLAYEPTRYGKTETYNIDLNTGEEFGLKEVFADNVDYAGMIRRQVEAVLKSFGIEPEKDLLDKYMEQYLADPQFELRNTTLDAMGIKYPDPSYLNGQEREITVSVHFDGNFAVTERFYDPGKSIYMGDLAGEKTLLTHVGEEEGWEKNYTEGDINIRLRGSYQKEFPEQVRQAIKAEEAPDSKLIDEMKQILKDRAGTGADAAYDKTVSTSKVQDFINVRIYENAWIYSEKTDTSYLNDSRQILRCYRKGSNEPANIRDIFVEGVDVEKTLEKLVHDKLELDQQALEESGYRRSMDVAAHAKGAADKFAGFCVNHESIFSEYLGDPALPSYVIELKYKDIGSENLNIFD